MKRAGQAFASVFAALMMIWVFFFLSIYVTAPVYFVATLLASLSGAEDPDAFGWIAAVCAGIAMFMYSQRDGNGEADKPSDHKSNLPDDDPLRQAEDVITASSDHSRADRDSAVNNLKNPLTGASQISAPSPSSDLPRHPHTYGRPVSEPTFRNRSIHRVEDFGHEISSLKYFGYTVGKSQGKPDAERRNIIHRVLHADFTHHGVHSDYLRYWGGAWVGVALFEYRKAYRKRV
ncbi:hypothetical protein [Parvularcula oceani]|uniref:hypothetical protein n=1 Tax=Parvularcula oceani TaxID=1247963 RepID=UPI0012DE515E|nr:hypothetical protein [Parvularcula oceani]